MRIPNFSARQRLQWSFPCLYDGERQTDFQWMEGVDPASLHSHSNLESSVACICSVSGRVSVDEISGFKICFA